MFVIGPNASGKSNLLDALRFLRQVASPGGGFQDAVANRGGMSRVRCLAARSFNHGHALMGITIGDEERPSRWSYQVTFTAEPRGRHRPILRSEIVQKDGEAVRGAGAAGGAGVIPALVGGPPTPDNPLPDSQRRRSAGRLDDALQRHTGRPGPRQGRGRAPQAWGGRHGSRRSRFDPGHPGVARRRHEPGRFSRPENCASRSTGASAPARARVKIVYFAVEGETDIPVADRMIRFVGREPRATRASGGKSRLDARIAELNRSGSAINWLILRDLDHDAPCPPALIAHLMGGYRLAPRLSLRIPVRAVESWLLADAQGFAEEFRVPERRLPGRPDDLDDPKQHLIDLCRYSVRRAIRNAMVPRPAFSSPCTGCKRNLVMRVEPDGGIGFPTQ